MTQLEGTYAEDDEEFEYVCRVFWWGKGSDIEWVNGSGEAVDVSHGDVLRMFGNGTWCALYRKK
jgi:hypothetical protein